MSAFETVGRARAASYNDTCDRFPHQLDFARLRQGPADPLLVRVREQIACPVLFPHGNFEDFDWLRSCSSGGAQVVTVDPCDLFAYVPDGQVWPEGNFRIGFLGGVEKEFYGNRGELIDRDAAGRWLDERPALDLLVTHDAPFGTSAGFRGNPQGSQLVSELIEVLRPAFHASSHYHHLRPPGRIGPTLSVGLNSVVGHFRSASERLQPGCMAVLDTEHNTIETIDAPWFADIPRTGFEWRGYIERLLAA